MARKAAFHALSKFSHKLTDGFLFIALASSVFASFVEFLLRHQLRLRATTPAALAGIR
jgi:hypothetical protein